MQSTDFYRLGRGLARGSWLALTIITVLCIVIGWLNMETVGPNEAGVLQYRPFLFGTSGVEKKIVMGPERLYVWPSTKVFKMPLAPITVTVHANDLMSSDRVPLEFDAAVTLQVFEPNLLPDMVGKVGTDPLTVFHTLVLQQPVSEGRPIGTPTGEFMSFLRDQVRHYPSSVFIAAQDIDGNISDGALTVEKNTREHINAFLVNNKAGMMKVTNIALGKANPPPGVKNAIEATATQAQDRKTQVEREKAATGRLAAEVAEAKADQAYMDNIKMNSDQFIEMQKLKTQKEVCKANHCTFIVGSTPVAVSLPSTSRTSSTASVAEKK